MNTNKKFTIIFSACQEHESNLLNLVNNQRLALYLACELHVEYQNAVGVYHGACEQSFVVHTNSSSVVVRVAAHVFDEYNQEAVLISQNRERDIILRYANPRKQDMAIGNTFKQHTSTPKADDYTVLNGTDYYTVY